MKNEAQQDLPDDLLELESKLSELVPNTLSQELHVRLERSMVHSSGSGIAAVESLDELELHLGQMAPVSMPDDLIERMVRAMDNWHEQSSEEENVYRFPAQNNEQRAKAPSKSYGVGMVGMAAAVALLGAITALMLPDFSKQDEPALAGKTSSSEATAQIQPSPAQPAKSLASASVPVGRLIGESLQHQVTNTSDQGVIVADDNTLHRCIRVEYRDQITVENPRGEQVEVTRPGVKYILLPVELY